MVLRLPAGEEKVLMLGKYRKLDPGKPIGPPEPPPSYEGEARLLEGHFDKGCFKALNGEERAEAEALLEDAYQGWVGKAWKDLLQVMHLQEAGRGKAGGEPYVFERRYIREVLPTKQNPRACEHRAAGWVAATLEEMMMLGGQHIEAGS